MQCNRIDADSARDSAHGAVSRARLTSGWLALLMLSVCLGCGQQHARDGESDSPSDDPDGDARDDARDPDNRKPTPDRDARNPTKPDTDEGPIAKPEPGDQGKPVKPPATRPIQNIDMLFVVDNAGSMRQEQAALRQQFPKFINTLTRGLTSEGTEFRPIQDIHLGVVSSDMGLAGIPNNFPSCNTQRHVNGGDDGVLQHPGNTGPECASSYPAFIEYKEGLHDPAQTARDFGCIANLGTGGCGFEQPLEAGLKALWPKQYTDADGNVFPPDKNPILFLSTTPEGQWGHGDTPVTQGGNGGFLRNDPVRGLSLIVIVLVTDEEDCSSRKTDHFISTNDPANPLSKQGINLRCFYNKQNLFDIERYTKGFPGLRPGHNDMVIFAAIAGVPPELVDDAARAEVDFSDVSQRDAYYDGILSDDRMIEKPQNENVPALANLMPSCVRMDSNGEPAYAYPPRRIVEVARQLGENAVVQSICQDDFGPAADAILAVIARRIQKQ